MKRVIFICFLFIFPLHLYSQNVGKIMFLRGKVTLDGNPAKKNDPVKEGAHFKTLKGSVLKVLFNDKSKMTLGPKSEAKVKYFGREKPGMLSLIKGNLRAKTAHDVMAKDKSKKSRLFIKTRGSAIGVRGSDGNVTFNEDNNVTSVITFEGEVALKDIPPGEDNYDAITGSVDQEDVPIIREGQFSSNNPKQGAVSTPTKPSPAQFNSLKQNEDFAQAKTKAKAEKFNNPIPPGMSVKDFTNDDSALSGSVGDEIGAEAVNEVKDEIKQEAGEGPPPEGSFNKETGEFAPPAGGFVDLSTGLYVPPPPGSTFDSNTGVYIPPADLGTFDAATGSYAPPEGFTLDSSGEFKSEEGAPTGENASPPPVISSVESFGGESFDSAVEDPVESNTAPVEASVESESVSDEDLADTLADVEEEFDNPPPSDEEVNDPSTTSEDTTLNFTITVE